MFHDEATIGLAPPRKRRLAAPLLLFALWFVASPARAQQPLSLREAAKIALENHPSLRAAAAEQDVARARYEQARAGYFPRFSFEENFTRGNNPVYVFGTLLTQRRLTEHNFELATLNAPTPVDNFQSRFNVSVRLFDSWRTERANQQAQLGTRLADASAERTRQELLLRVVRAYYELVLASANIRVATDSVRTAQSNLERAQSLYDAGMITGADVLSARVHLSAMQQEEIRARNRAAVAVAAFDFELGVPEATAYALPETLPEPQSLTAALDELQQAALVERPEFQEMELQRAIAEKSSAIARSGFGPSLSLFGSWEADKPAFASSGGTNWLIGTKLELNLFNGGADRARLAEARARERQMEAFKALLASRIRLEVRQSYLELEAARQQVELTRTTADQAAESLRIIENRYEAGLTTITELLRAETDLHRARVSHLAARYEWQVTRAALERAVGRLRSGSAVFQP